MFQNFNFKLLNYFFILYLKYLIKVILLFKILFFLEDNKTHLHFRNYLLLFKVYVIFIQYWLFNFNYLLDRINP
jgi:hypothetical protein